ncbi:MAG: lactate utilization protein [Bacteroidia bacterium]|jgi:L-lactate dehydrogenase complex protein LldF|nr:lactate utilization protein [Bacteroidia bacterium]
MSDFATRFQQAAEAKVFDREHRKKLQFNIGQYDKKVIQGKQQFSNIELARTRAAGLRNKVVENLDKYLIEFEANFLKRGGKIIWATDAAEAAREISQVLSKNNITSVIKSKSMVTEEIGLNEHLKKEGIESLETDLGEYIQQIDNEAPYHIVTPAMHKSKEDVAKLFHEKKGTAPDMTPAQVMAWVREHLREKYLSAGAGITGANFLMADSGTIAISENEGNAVLSMGFPKIHIVITGIEKIIPSQNDLDLFWPLLSTYGTGQQLTVYNTIIGGPRQNGETDGPEELILVLLDNGRTSLLAQTEQRRALGCIRCGACLNACPVYEGIGGHAYNATYSGPIGSVLMPWMGGMENYRHLSNASSLCGKCTEVCPVKIDLHKLLLYNRRDANQQGMATKTENVMWFFWKGAMLKRSKMEKGGSKLKNFMLRQFFRKQWGNRRELPAVAPKSFNQIWRERKGIR